MTTTDDLDTKATYPSFLGWWLWAATGAAAALAAISTIGVFVAPVAVVAAIWLWRRTDRSQRLGFVTGVGLLVLGVGLAHLGANPCPEVGTETGSEAAACGGLNPLPWLVSGVVLVTGPVVFLRHRRTRVTGRSSHRR